MHCFKDHINNRKYFLHFIRLLLPPKSLILPNLGGHPYDWIHEKIDQYGQNSHTEPPSSMTMQVVNFTSQTHQSCCKYPFMMLINVNERLCVKGNGELNVFNPGLKNQRFDKPTAKSADEEGKKTHVMCCEVPQTQIIIAWSFYICVKG